MPADGKIPPTKEEEEEHHHDAPIDDAKRTSSVKSEPLSVHFGDTSADGCTVDSLLLELVKFCLPIGLVLWLSIYLMYRNQFSDWSARVPGGGSSTRGLAAQGGAPEDRLGGWIKQEEKMAWREMINNVGPAAGAAEGAVVASPSSGEWEDEPDYYVS